MIVCALHCVFDLRVRLWLVEFYMLPLVGSKYPLPENPPWGEAFDAEKSGIDEVCRVLAHLYSLPKAQYIAVCKDGDSFTFSNESMESQSQAASKDVPQSSPPADTCTSVPKGAPGEANIESSGGKGALVK